MRCGFIGGDHTIDWFVRRTGKQRGGGGELQEGSSIHGG
jgi:hypothetical protein